MCPWMHQKVALPIHGNVLLQFPIISHQVSEFILVYIDIDREEAVVVLLLLRPFRATDKHGFTLARPLQRKSAARSDDFVAVLTLL